MSKQGIRRNALWITRTAVLIAVLVAMQVVTAPLGNQFITGFSGNLIMIVALLTCGPATGLTVAVVSPICASLAGFGPAFPPIIPFIALGNAALIGAWSLFCRFVKPDRSALRQKAAGYLIAIAAALIKFLTLYMGVVKIAVPYILDLNEKQSAMLTLAFSYPQIITATIGGAFALIVSPPIQKALGAAQK